MVIFAMNFTLHTTTQPTPMQLVFGRNAIMNLTSDANWNIIKQHKQKIYKKLENRKNNCTHLQVNDLVLVKNNN